MPRLAAALVTCLMLAACASTVDRSVTATGQSSRVRYIVLHYTTADDAESLRLLSQTQVSAHYLVSARPDARVYQLVDENRSAWHAGASRWFEQNSLNFTSIGIEIVNAGWQKQADGTLLYAPYLPAQITALSHLLREIAGRHGIRPENIVGHSDIAPQRKLDPGPAFPWRALAQEGIGRWYNEDEAATQLLRLQSASLPDVAWFQTELARLGYDTPRHGKLDRATRNVLTAFQMHYRPTHYDGQPDAETAAIMKAMKAQP
ncbi:N-acetylmuramoyl-L-alanine amidase [Bordetella holmesii]|uniref:N-acetylmuramoyl-L-alanine amidase n=2 Tax=Bordetella holmesii TaxID=35814 RepID=A0A158M8G0_9BORD|nr:N-acetylmuramoyl-L-alanine amidase [Bordetella holmesii]AHV94106.1 N-acetylmuramoyl-L-alanine amidase family protein [Bordetella holmesii ATCC 51541]AIT26940.1 N-acetylmuramoyl-L-alanine amidase family protein [Bordetella holmesii 44057]EWM44175.1 N-acetylmuramoyl-L-alanine amidase family protein [Bordetella holmesii 41130]EWM47524.1 N-acetylmuramoyl-L-alanine amidase family protein [Bordetella holmesii 35009]EWM51691.1 N-acetylmuramoyl-L-alanine amidase family protein [Bordetella holmesii 